MFSLNSGSTAAECFGARVAAITRRFKNGVVFETDRIDEAEFRRGETSTKRRFILKQRI